MNLDGTDKLIIGIASFFVVLIISVAVYAVNQPKTYVVAECPDGYEFVEKQTFNGRAWCVDGGSAVQPVYTRLNR